MRQLLLDLLPESHPRLENFIVGRNAEAIAALSQWLLEGQDTCFFLWGETGSGKTHLLKGCEFTWLDGADPTPWGELDTPTLAVDNVDALNAEQQIALFNQFNQRRHHGGKLLVAAPQAPARLDLREDLRTRLGSGLIYRLHPLSDAEKHEAIALQCASRNMKLAPEAIDYLLRHAPRNMRTLSALIVALDRYSLEQKRPLTLPLLREVLAAPLEP